MNLSTLLQPPKAPPERPETERPDPVRARERVRQRSARYRRAVALGIAASVLLHVLIVFVSPLVIRFVEPIGPITGPRAAVRAVPEGTQVIDVRVTDTPAPARPEPRPEPVEEEPAPQPGPREAAAEPAEDPGAAAPTAAERLRPRVGDWRLWVSPPIAERDLTSAEREALLRERLYTMIEAYNDSAAAEAARRAGLVDWTVGEEGNRWGVSPGKIHLGPITLPLPFQFAPHPAVQRDQARDQAEWDAIQRQAGQGAIDEAFEDRVRAIRERRERERAERDTTSNR